MRTSYTRVWFLFFVSLLVFLPAMVARADNDKAAKPVKKTQITGYGEYLFGTLETEIDLTGFTGPFPDASHLEFQQQQGISVFFYKRAESLRLAGHDWKTELTLFFINERLEGASLNFKDLVLHPKDLDLVGIYVKDLRDALLDIYDKKLKKQNDFYFTYSVTGSDGWLGTLVLEDEKGNLLSLFWRGYALHLFYSSSNLHRFTEDAKAASERESEGKL